MEDLYRLLRTGDAQAQSIVDTIELPLLVLDQTFQVVNANPAFCRTFRLNGDDTIGRSLFDLGDGEWNVDELRTLLSAVIPKARAIVDYELTRVFPGIGKRTMLVSARKLVQPGNSIMLLVVFEDITEQKRTDAAKDIILEETRHRMRNLLAAARAQLRYEPEGLRATLWLPVALQYVARSSFRNAAGRPARVLVVEDELLIALEIEDSLSSAGVEVIGPASTVGAALALLDHERPDAAVLDANLRGEWVIPVAEALRSLKIPFVLASAYDQAQWEDDTALAGTTNLGKPTTAPVLLEALETMLAARG